MTPVMKIVPLSKVRDTKLVTPDNAGAYYKGIKHGDLVNCLIGEFKHRGWRIKDSEYMLNDNGMDLVATYIFEPLPLPIYKKRQVEGCSPCLVATASNSIKAPRTRLWVGLWDETFIPFSRAAFGKHTTKFDLNTEVVLALRKWREEFPEAVARANSLMRQKVGQSTVDGLIMHASRMKKREYRLAWGHLGYVHDEFKRLTVKGKKTYWNLVKAFSLVAKDSAALHKTQRTHAFCMLAMKHGLTKV